MYDIRMRSRRLLAVLLAVSPFVLPLAAHAAIPFFGPVIPAESNICPAGWGMMIIVINNLISLLITLAIVLVAPLMIAWSGFLFVVNPVNASGKEEAKKILLNTIVGIVIALAGWLIVDAIMAVLYKPSDAGGAWSTLIVGNSSDVCLSQRGALPTVGLNQAAPGSGITGVTASGASFSTALSTAQGSPCNPSTVLSAAQAAGYPISSNQANMLACIAQGESTCGTTNPPYNLNYSWNKATSNGKASTAAGAYQVLLKSNSTCYDNSVCESAGGTPGAALNCTSGFDSNGFPIAGSSVVTRCQQAAGNVNCSAAAAACLLQRQSFAAAYATDPYTASCQSKYGG